MIAQRSLYILGLINLILAGVAIICVIQAEDDPEYFSLVYVTVCIFIFYMATIVFIIMLQVVQTYKEQNKKKTSSTFSSSSSIQAPLLTPKVINRTNQVLVETTITNAQPKTILSRSHTLPLTSFPLNSHHSLSNSALPSVTNQDKYLKPDSSTHLELTPKHHHSTTSIPKHCQSFTLAKNDLSRETYRAIRNSDKNSLSPNIIKPMPLKYHGSMKVNKPKITFSES